MARRIICREGAEWGVNGNVIQPGALTWDESGKIPLLDPSQSEILGYASDLRREEDGAITAEFHFIQGDTNLDALSDGLTGGWGWTVFVKDVKYVNDRELWHRTVTNGHIGYSFLGYGIPWDGASQKKQGS